MPNTIAVAEPRALSADILPPRVGPSLSATSDMPIVVPAEIVAAKPVAEVPKVEDKPADKPGIAAEPAKEPEKIDPPKKKNDGFPDDMPAWQKRELTTARNQKRAAEDARKVAEDARERAETALARALELAERVGSDKPKDAPSRPKRDTFDTPEAYDTALDSWLVRQSEQAATTAIERQKAADAQAEAKRLETEAETARQEELRGRAITFQQRADKVKAQHEDYDEVVMKAPDEGGPVITDNMSLAILEADNGPEIAYHLGKNRAEADRIAALSPARQVYEIGRISLRIENDVAAAEKAEADAKISKAAAPITPIVANSNRANAKGPDDESMEEYAARRRGEEAARKKAERPAARA